MHDAHRAVANRLQNKQTNKQTDRSPSKRHVSRTHRVALDWLVDRVNWDPQIQRKYVDTKNQLADMLTKGNITRDEWNHLLRSFSIMNFSMFSCSRVTCPRELRKARLKRVRRCQGTSPKESGAANSPGNQESDQSSVPWSTRKLVREGSQATKNHQASGNRCEVLSHLLRKKSLNFKSTSELKELHKMES